MSTKFTSVGITCGIGSLLVGAKQAGFDVVANIEWRKYYHKRDERGLNTFTENFMGSAFKQTINELTPQEIERVMNPSLALGHPECGAYSQLSSMNPDKSDDPGDIPLFVDLVKRIRPVFFAMDDLPRSFCAFPMREYAVRLPDYDLFPEWISNYHYGNVQKNRKRMFMIGSLKSERWAFTPGERENTLTISDVLGDLGEPRRGSNYPNHDPHTLDEKCGRAKHLVTLGRDHDATYAQLRDFFLSNRPGVALQYVSRHGDGMDTPNHGASGGLLIKHKPGHTRASWDGHAYVLDGASVQVHPLTGLPYSIRDRARIQGFPDDFVFYGTKFNDRGEWNHEKNNDLVKQTGKAMPIQFGRYVSEQVMSHLTDDDFVSSRQRMIPPNPWVDDAKRWYCENVGYANQPRACSECWLYATCSIRMRKYQIGEPARGQRDAFDPGVVPGADLGLEIAGGGDAPSPTPDGVGGPTSSIGPPDRPAGGGSPVPRLAIPAAGPRRRPPRSGYRDTTLGAAPSHRRQAPARSARFVDTVREDEYDLTTE